MPKGVPNKRYTPAFKRMVVETMEKEHLSIYAAMQEFGINDHKTVSYTHLDVYKRQVHTFVEQTLTARVGAAGKRLHTGRSRKDVYKRQA